MKKTFLTAAFSMIAMVSIAQKKEIRNAEKAIKQNNFTEAKSYINQAQGAIANEKDKVKADFYYTKAMAYLGGENNHNLDDMVTASEAMQKAIELGHKDAQQGMQILKNQLVTSAIKDQESQQYENAAQKLIASYNLDNRDTIYLYYAAANYVSGQHYAEALNNYEQLLDLGFTGVENQYFAINKETGEEELFSKTERDLMVKSGSYIKPQDRKSPPKIGEITKNIALIHIQNGDDSKALQAIERAKKENPGDTELLLVEADVYSKMGDMKNYKVVMEEVIKSDPNNPALYYNLGVSSANLGDNENAIKYYKKALELNPQMVNAQLNIATIILERERAIVDEMNSLGNTKADNKKYDELSKERKQIYSDAVPYLEAALQTEPNNVEVVRTMMNIYYQLENNQKAEEMKKKLSQIQQ